MTTGCDIDSIADLRRAYRTVAADDREVSEAVTQAENDLEIFADSPAMVSQITKELRAAREKEAKYLAALEELDARIRARGEEIYEDAKINGGIRPFRRLDFSGVAHRLKMKKAR